MRIAALYPESEFDGIASGLRIRLARISASKLRGSADSCIDATDAMLNALTKEVSERLYGKIQAGVVRLDEDSQTALADAIEERLEYASKTQPGSNSHAAYIALGIVTACWWSCWLMANHASLPRKLRSRADELMLVVDQLFELRVATPISKH